MASSNGTKTYRHSVTGKVGDFPESLAQHFPALVEVDSDAKPLAYVPIPQDAIDDFRSQMESAGSGDADNPESTNIEEVN